MAAKIILRKRNTSQTKVRVTDGNGQVKWINRPVANGRGDFVLYINKKALSFRVEVVACTEVDEDEAISPGPGKNSQQPQDISFDTIKIDNHKCGKGVAAPPEQWAGRGTRPEMKKHRNEEDSMPEGISAKGRRHLARLKREQDIARQLPQTELEYYATLLFHQARKQLYAHYSEHYAQRIAPHAKNLLRLHLLRLQCPPEKAFQNISRAIQMVYRYTNTQSEAYVYDLLTWLRIDDDFKSGTLRYVIDHWIPEEERRLKVTDRKNKALVRWQYAYHFANQLFSDVIKALRESFSQGLRTYQQAFQRLDYYFEKYAIPPRMSKKLRKQFADRTYAILVELRMKANA